MRKCLSFIITLLIIMSFSISSFAAEEIGSGDSSFSNSKYLELKNEGLIDEDISYEDLKDLYDQSKKLEKDLENNAKVKNKEGTVINTSTVGIKAGDVLITNGTSSAGILGHAGIALSSSEILHIAGFNKPVTVISPRQWEDLYKIEGWTQVYRSTSSTASTQAAKWARETYEGSDAEYVLVLDLSSTDKTYCSKLVWQAYYYGAGQANGPAWGIRLPYDLPSTIHNLKYVGDLY